MFTYYEVYFLWKIKHKCSIKWVSNKSNSLIIAKYCLINTSGAHTQGRGVNGSDPPPKKITCTLLTNAVKIHCYSEKCI